MLQGHKGHWTIYNEDGTINIELDCVYDSTDYLAEVAELWTVDYENKKITIIRRRG